MSTTATVPTLPTEPLSVQEAISKRLYHYFQDFSQFVASELRRRMVEDGAVAELHMYSPDGSVWKLTVDDTGATTTTKVFDAP